MTSDRGTNMQDSRQSLIGSPGLGPVRFLDCAVMCTRLLHVARVGYGVTVWGSGSFGFCLSRDRCITLQSAASKRDGSTVANFVALQTEGASSVRRGESRSRS